MDCSPAIIPGDVRAVAVFVLQSVASAGRVGEILVIGRSGVDVLVQFEVRVRTSIPVSITPR